MKRLQRACLASGAVAALLAALALMPAAHAATPALTVRPREFVAFGRVAVVRLVSTYYAQVITGGQASLVPVPLCTGLGTIVATIGASGNTHTFVLTDATLVSPVRPCAGAVASYLNLYKTLPAQWRLTAVTAYLNTAYTGDGASQAGALSFALDTSTLPTLGITGGPVALPITLAAAPAYDLPVVPVPASAPTGQTQLLDLGNASLQPFTQDTLTATTTPTELTPIESGAGVPDPAPSPTAAPITPTVVATKAPTPTPVVALTLPVSLGAPVLASDSTNGADLAGMVIATPTGEATASVAALTAALRAAFAVSTPGAFDQRWKAGLDAYYAASATNPQDPEYHAAAQEFSYVQAHYPSFTGVLPWLHSAEAGSPQLGATAAAPPKSSSSITIIPGLPLHTLAEIIAFALAALVVAGLFFWLRALILGMRRARMLDAPAAIETGAEEDDITEKTASISPEYLAAAQRESLRRSQSLMLRSTIPLHAGRRVARLGLQAVGTTDPGLRRKATPNQDSILAVQGARLHEGAPQPFGLFVVADGMGGHQFGREASSETIRVMADHILQPLLGGDALDDDALMTLLKDGTQHANEILHYRNLRQHADMGTTVTAALVAGDTAFIVNVGDSRTYHLQPDMPLRQVTMDHSVVASLVAAGVIKPDDIYTHPKRNQIYRSLGEQEEIQIDTFQVPLNPGDHLLLCSDGLWEMVRDPRIEALVRTHDDLHALTELLIEEANANGGVDNISAIVVRMLEEDATPRQVGMHVLAGPPGLKGA